MNLKPYPEYKDSGVAWLGDVPRHWAVHPLKRYAKNIINNVISKNSEELYIALEHIEGWTGRFKKNREAKFTGQVKRFSETDVLLGKLRPYLAKVAFPKEKGVCVGEILSIRPNVNYLLGTFLEKSFLSFPFIGIVNGSTYGSKMPRTEWDFIGNLGFPIIPLPEQNQIARFLDYKTAQIARFIKAKKRMIELLKEQKQVIINDAVTGKIDVATGKPYPKYKDSGMEWLGQVPEGWEVLPLRWHILIGSGEFRSGNLIRTEKSSDYQYPVIGGNGVLGYTNSNNSEDNLIIIGRVGALCGNVHYVKESAWITDNALRIDDIRKFQPEFLALQLKAMNLNKLSNANAQPLITGGIIKSQKVVFPPLNEQLEILKYIEHKTAAIGKTISRTEREIALMQEYRTRLISDVVTGKIDVRGIEIPDIADIDDTLDEAMEETEGKDEWETEEAEECIRR
ncbi:MAG: restriction endonuclease subunit S [Candidatus Brocadia sp.]|uniref:Restriction endonuclease n=1 Tax=Candidatus Brocadia fulgida TaxID=380242 RepID=A0A0M2UVK7_9BACT|nr:MAG: putative restriction endonuclease [Candidatus Brocadia fulgida]UJS19865.1 MAG: restriction endonuclease subunit S [Candidatus Brocadia sp.]